MQDVQLDPPASLACPQCGDPLKGIALAPLTEVTCPSCQASVPVPGRFGPFVVRSRIQQGLTTSLFDALDPTLDRSVSLKVLHRLFSSHPDMAAGFKREALAAAALNSPNVLRVYEFSVVHNQPFMVMEEVRGEFLHEVMQRERLGERAIFHILEGVVQGLMDTHACGIVLGDIMPRHVLIDPDGIPKLCDFGLARFQHQQQGQEDNWSSPNYMPPERILGLKEDARSDFYALGTTLFYMLCDQLPFFDLDDERVKERKISEPPPDPRQFRPDLTPEFAELTLMLLHRDPDRRPQNFDELFHLLEQVRPAVFARKVRAPVLPPPPPSPVALAAQKHHIATWVLLGISFLALLGIVHRVLHQAPAPLLPPPPTATPTPEPVPTPLPLATPTPEPAPQPTPVPPRPTPTPVPLVVVPQDFVFEFLLDRLPQESRFREFNQREMRIFQPETRHQPAILPDRFGNRPGLKFDNSILFSNLPFRPEDPFTYVVVARFPPPNTQIALQVMLGVEDTLGTGGGFRIQHHSALPGSLIFESPRRNARLTLTRAERERPFVLVFRRTPQNDRAFAGTQSLNLSGTPSPLPPAVAPALQTLQIGDLLDRNLPFFGEIGLIRIYDRALSDREIQVLLADFEQRFGALP